MKKSINLMIGEEKIQMGLYEVDVAYKSSGEALSFTVYLSDEDVDKFYSTAFAQVFAQIKTGIKKTKTYLGLKRKLLEIMK